MCLANVVGKYFSSAQVYTLTSLGHYSKMPEGQQKLWTDQLTSSHQIFLTVEVLVPSTRYQITGVN